MSLVYKIKLSDEARKTLKKIDKSIAVKLLTKLESDLKKLTNPRQAGKALKGDLGSLWRYT